MHGPDLIAAQATEASSLKDALRQILGVHTRQWTIEQLDSEVRERDLTALASPFAIREAIELAVTRLVAAGEAEWVGPGVVRHARRARVLR